jgi:predicted Zn finger-like uncharacterized protein
MHLACQTCQARYRIADERVRGKIVKIRCKKCGTIVTVDGPLPRDPPPLETPPLPLALTGERNEESLLFSLSAIQGRAPERVVPEKAADSGLIDLRRLSEALRRPERAREPSDAIAHLGSGGPFLPLFVEEREVSVRPRPRWPRMLPMVVASLVVLLAVMVSRQHAPRVATSPPPVAAPPVILQATAPATEPAVIRMDTEGRPTVPPPSAAPPPPKRVAALVAPRPRTVPSATPPPPSVHPCCAGEDETTCAMRRAVGGSCGRAGL